MERNATRIDGRSKSRPGTAEQAKFIKNAAVDLFIERGSEAVSVSQICARADVGRQTFYRCFPDKDALIAELYDHAIQEHVAAAVGRMPSRSDDNDWVYTVVDEVIDAILAERKLAQLLYVEAANPNSPAFAIAEQAYDRAARAIADWFARNTGHRPDRAYLKSVLAATSYLVHGAIIDGAGAKAVVRAKAGARRLFEGVYLSAKRRA